MPLMYERELDAGRDSAIDDSIIEAWLHGRSENTRDAYGRDVARFLSHAGTADGPKPLVELSLDDVQAWASALEADGLAKSTRARKLSAVRSLLKFASEEGHVERNVARTVKPPRSRDDIAARILTEGEVTRMVYLSEGIERTVIRLLYAAGLRVSELCGLRACDLTDRDDDGGSPAIQLTVFGKGEKTREVIVSGEAADELRARVAEFTYKLTGDCSSPEHSIFGMSRQQVWRLVRDAAERAGIKKSVSPHWLRHAHASHALDRGAPVHLVQQTLGHASLATTTRYAHARPDESSGRYLAL
jgi:integrase/recombinase XerD